MEQSLILNSYKDYKGCFPFLYVSVCFYIIIAKRLLLTNCSTCPCVTFVFIVLSSCFCLCLFSFFLLPTIIISHSIFPFPVSSKNLTDWTDYVYIFNVRLDNLPYILPDINFSAGLCLDIKYPACFPVFKFCIGLLPDVWPTGYPANCVSGPTVACFTASVSVFHILIAGCKTNNHPHYVQTSCIRLDVWPDIRPEIKFSIHPDFCQISRFRFDVQPAFKFNTGLLPSIRPDIRLIL